MSVTEELINFLVSVRYEDLSKDVVDGAKRLILNTIAATLAGSSAPGVKETASLVKEWGGKREATVLLHNLKVPAHEAVMVNATMGRALDFDEFNIQTGVHAGATVVPTALAGSEIAPTASGKEFITAVVVGAELMSRMRMVPDQCIGISGWTGEVFGAFGAAATLGRMSRFTHQQMWNSLGLALSQSAGISQTIYDGVLATRLQQGFSARAGVLSARLASRGVTGASDFLEGKAGFYPVYYRGLSYNTHRLVDGLGTDYRFLTMATKPYPCCGFIMAPIENLMGIMKRHNLVEDDLTEVAVHVNEQMYNTVCSPPAAKYRPHNEADAMFSLPYVLGTLMVRGNVWLDDFAPRAIQDLRRLAATDKIAVIRDAAIDEESKRLNLTLSLHSMVVRTKDGRTLSEKLYHAKGFPQNPMTLKDCAEKARRCAPFAVTSFPDEKVDSLRGMIERLEEIPRPIDLANLLA